MSNEQNEQRFWLVWSPSGAMPPKFKHYNEDGATYEAARLARAHPGQTFVVLEAKTARRCDNMVVIDYTKPEEPPF